MDWINDILGPATGDLEWYQTVSRAVIVYFIAMLYLRVAGMRSIGSGSAFDVVITITMGAVLSRAISGHYPFLSSILAALALAICHRLIAFISYKSTIVRHLTEGQPVLLFNDGILLTKNLRLHSIHPADLEKTLREQGINSYDKVKSIWYEVDGKISVVKK
jgi:uncharacterized membrane protein YcaP (DUF421 family)